MNGSSSETQGFGSTVTDGQSQTMDGSFALSTSRTRDIEDRSARMNGRTWNFSGSNRDSSLVTEGMSEAEQSTWSTSESFRTVRDFGGTIPRNRVGMFYRQTTRTVKRAEVRAYDQCGLAEHIGEIQMSEWQWAPDLAIAERLRRWPAPAPSSLRPASSTLRVKPRYLPHTRFDARTSINPQKFSNFLLVTLDVVTFVVDRVFE